MNGEVNLDFMRIQVRHNRRVFLLSSRLRSFVWYSVCITFGEGKTALYLNGEEQFRNDIKENVTPLNATLLKVGAWDDARSFSGELTQMNMWGRLLSLREIQDISRCQSVSEGDVIAWGDAWSLHGDVTQHDMAIESICDNDLGPDYFIFPALTADKAFHVCEGIGGQVPLPKTFEEINSLLTIAQNVTGNNSDVCRVAWVGATDTEIEGTFIGRQGNAPYNPPWVAGEPNGYIFQNCLWFRPAGIVDAPCNRLVCLICHVAHRPVWTLLGACQQYRRNTQFISVQEDVGQLSFLGYADYKILHNAGENQWVWLNWQSDTIIARMPHPKGFMEFPMGRRTWTLEQAVCQKQKGDQITLSLSPCQQNSFTCNDSTCVPMRQRCDRKLDCRDGSDETNCQLVNIPPQYQQDLPPRNLLNNSMPLPIAVTFNIESVNVKTSEMQIHLKFNLSVIWQDARLTFLNLNKDYTLNRVSEDTMPKLWAPLIDFTNAKDNEHTLKDNEVQMVVNLQGTPSVGDDTIPEEVEKYSGWQTPLSIRRKYSVTFQCEFQLTWYPFDTQDCHVVLTMLEGSSRLLVFNETSSTASFEGDRSLVEYTFNNVHVYFENDRDYAVMSIEMHLRRRAGFILMTVYIPSLCLMCITYLTLYFNPANFQVRVLACLTSLLVMATLFTKASSSLPKTSYFKMVDVWLLSSIIIIFFIIICHLIIDRVQDWEKNRAKTGPFKVSPSNVVSQHTQNSKPLVKKPLDVQLIFVSKISVLVFLVLFNIIYWSAILLQ